MNLPTLALSVRQPWAWAIFHGKDIENRSWHARHPSRRRRPTGPVCIHAAQGMTKGEYEDAAEFITKLIGHCPKPHQLVRGAIIGTVLIRDGVLAKNPAASSPWFFGPYGLLLADPKSMVEHGSRPIRAKGELGWFNWKPSEEPWPETARWMQPKAEALL